MADKNYIDVDSALSRLGGNNSLYEKLLAKFENNVDIQGFDEAIKAGDFKAAGDIAHTAKGVAGNLSLMAFFDQSVIVMNQLRNEEYDEGSVKEFKELFAETITAINDYIGS